MSMLASPTSSCPPVCDWAMSRLSSSGVPPSASAFGSVPSIRRIEFDGAVQQHDERVEQRSGRTAAAARSAAPALGVLDRVELRDDLADDDLRAGDQQVGDHDRDRDRGRVPSASSEHRLEHVRDRRLAERADADRGHRDPDLAGGDVVADLVELRERQRARRARPPRPAPRAAARRERTSAYSAITKNALTSTSRPVRMMNSAFTYAAAGYAAPPPEPILRPAAPPSARAATSGWVVVVHSSDARER